MELQTERANHAETLVDTKAGLLAAERTSCISLPLENMVCEEKLRLQVSHASPVPQREPGIRPDVTCQISDASFPCAQSGSRHLVAWSIHSSITCKCPECKKGTSQQVVWNV